MQDCLAICLLYIRDNAKSVLYIIRLMLSCIDSYIIFLSSTLFRRVCKVVAKIEYYLRRASPPVRPSLVFMEPLESYSMDLREKLYL
jgi:hypothetical protein